MDPQFQKIQDGDIRAFERLFRDQYDALFRFAFRFVSQRETAEELVQDAFVALWEKRQSIQVTSSLSAYLFSSVRNRAFNHLKSHYHQRTQAFDPKDLERLNPYSDSDLTDQAALIAVVQQGILSLPERCRIIFQLSRQAGLTYEEIAEELGISKETVKSQIKIALQKLRLFLGGYWDKLGMGLICINHYYILYSI